MSLTALLSVSDKTGIVDFARALHDSGVKLLSTGGTAKLLAESGLPVTEVSEITGFPEMLDGRVKTLHPRVHGGLLARRDVPEHMAALKEHGIGTIDLLIINLYPFAKATARPDCTLANEVNLTHEFLSMMLSVRRPGVTGALNELTDAGIIATGHGRISILNRKRLEATACECYRTVRAKYGRLLGRRLIASPRTRHRSRSN